MRRIVARFAVCGVLAFSLFFAGCDGGGNGDNGDGDLQWADDSFDVDIEWKDGIVRIDDDRMALLTASDVVNHVYTFDKAGVEQAGLDFTAGKVLVIYGMALRKITSATEEGDNLVVQTEPAALTDAIENGTIEWDYGVEFTAQKVQSIYLEDGAAQPKRIAEKAVGFDFEVSPYKYYLEVDLQDTRAAFKFTIKKDLVSPAGGEFTAEGYLGRFRSKDYIGIKDGQLDEFRHSLEKLSGEVTLSLTVAASGDDTVNLELPVTILEVPIAGSIVPATLKIRVQFVVNAKVPVEGSSRVKVVFKYDSDLGLTSDGVDVSLNSRMGSPSADDDVTETGAAFAISANFGIGFPRIELDIFNETGVLWAQPAFLIGGSFAPAQAGFPTCQTADAQFLAAAGFKAKLGLFSIAGNKTFFEHKWPLLRAGDCPDD